MFTTRTITLSTKWSQLEKTGSWLHRVMEKNAGFYYPEVREHLPNVTSSSNLISHNCPFYSQLLLFLILVSHIFTRAEPLIPVMAKIRWVFLSILQELFSNKRRETYRIKPKPNQNQNQPTNLPKTKKRKKESNLFYSFLNTFNSFLYSEIKGNFHLFGDSLPALCLEKSNWSGKPTQKSLRIFAVLLKFTKL